MSPVVCILVHMLQWTILLRIPLIIVVSRQRIPNGFTTKKNMFAVNTVISDIEKFDGIQSLVSNMNHQGQGDSTKTYW
jgi:hypothetical protein